MALNETVYSIQLVSPVEATDAVLLGVHTPAYLERLSQSKSKVVKLTELFLLYLVPNRVLQRKIVRPARYHAAGTILVRPKANNTSWRIALRMLGYKNQFPALYLTPAA